MDKLEKVLDIIDHQDKYSDEEIREILQDEECRKLYQTMQEVDSALMEKDGQVDVDAEWQRFDREHFGEKHSQFSWRKMAAAVTGLVLVSGLTFAAIHIYVRKSQQPMPISDNATHVVVKDSIRQDSTKTLVANDTKAAKPVIHKTFENVAFDKMMAEIAAYYDMQVRFDNADAKSLRLYYDWDSLSSIEDVVNELDQFENVNIKVEGQTIVIK